MRPEEIDKVRRGQVDKDMLEVEQDCEEEGTSRQIVLHASLVTVTSFSRSLLTSRAATRLKRRIPRSIPLYWKCIESTKIRPGCRKSEAAIVRAVESALRM